MPQSDYIVVHITASSVEEAQLIARVLLEQRLAACVNIVPQVNSHFWWQGKIDSAEESLLVVKTRASLLDDLIQSVREVHSNEVPEIIALPIIGGSKDYLDWLDKETSGEHE